MTGKRPGYGNYKSIQKKHRLKRIIVIVEVNIIVIVVLLGIAIALRSHQVEKPSILGTGSYSAADFSIPQYSGSAYVEINDNIPFFEESDITSTPYEEYSSLDRLGRCGPAMACLGRETMPTEERGEIGMIRPSGWKASCGL